MENTRKRRKARIARFSPEDEVTIEAYLIKTKLTYQALSELSMMAYIQANPK